MSDFFTELIQDAWILFQDTMIASNAREIAFTSLDIHEKLEEYQRQYPDSRFYILHFKYQKITEHRPDINDQ